MDVAAAARRGRAVSASCFRVLSLQLETQNEVDVLKPLLEELEVLRLSCALGALPHVDATSVAAEPRDARAFDEHVARFLRCDVFGTRGDEDPTKEVATTPRVRVVGLFGRQAQVTHQLCRLKGWDAEMETALRPRDQGLYAVVLPAAASGADKPLVVVFAWVVDELLHAGCLRDTPTYLLRLLTCLTRSVTCCLSATDRQLLESSVQSCADGGDDDDALDDDGEYKSYSIAFHVAKQQDATDDMRSSVAQTLPVPPTATPPRRVEMLKGSFPAAMAITEAPPHKASSHETKRFDGAAAFCHWLAERKKQYNLRVSASAARKWSGELRDTVVRHFGEWPAAALAEIERRFEQSTEGLDEQCRDDVARACDEYRVALETARRAIFRVEAMKSDRGVDASKNLIGRWLRELKDDPSCALSALTTVMLSLPLRLHDVLKHCYRLFQGGHHAELDDALQKAPMATVKALVSHAKQHGDLKEAGRRLYDWFVGQDIPDAFRERMREPLEAMSASWWHVVEDALDRVRERSPTVRADKKRRELRHVCDADRGDALGDALAHVLRAWQLSHEHALDCRVDVECLPRHKVSCWVERERLLPSPDQVQVWSVATGASGVGGFRIERLGEVSLAFGEEVVQVFSIQTRSILIVSCSLGKTHVRRVEFADERSWNARPPECHHIRELGRPATLCDYNHKERMLMVGNADEGVSMYRLNERFSSMEVMRSVDVAARTSLALPLRDALLSEGSLHLVGHDGSVQSLSIRNLQTSKKVAVAAYAPDSVSTTRSRLVRVLDGTSLGWMESHVHDGSPRCRLRFFATDDMRELPQSKSAEIALASADAVSCQAFGDHLFVLDSTARKVVVVAIDGTLKSESYRIRSVGQTAKNGGSTATPPDATAPTVADHWLWSLYHLYEKFPVRGELDRAATAGGSPLQLAFVCDTSSDDENALMARGCHKLLGVVMERLQQLNKPLHGVNLSSAVAAICSADDMAAIVDVYGRVAPQAVATLLRELITFVPVQICRAEFNTLTLLSDGMQQQQPHTSSLGSLLSLNASDIAQSLRFGLLSPLLLSWPRQCIVVTSMGKQSTGKSYFLNHLTGSSFAISGARCTDGAWMSVRFLSSGVMLVVIDFEGLGSFERTEQEDVFLSVLNASVSMLTVFRMEMRLDKEIDELFGKFQKGSQLIKNDPQLFRGKLYMSVKDVNPNDQRGVVDEFGVKFQRLLEANREQNFLTDMYAGQLEINCSPPLGTLGYYRSLAHAQRYIDRQLCGDATAGFPSGKAFLDCIRLLLAKISILDWTSLDESALNFKIAELSSKLPIVLRYGCLPAEGAVTTAKSRLIEERLVNVATGDEIDASFEQVCAAHGCLANQWRALRLATPFDDLDDERFDLGPCAASSEAANTDAASQAVRGIFHEFVSQKDRDGGGAGFVVVSKALQAEFDVFLSFAVRRRCLRVQSWCRSAFASRVPDAWATAEQQAFASLQTRLVRCLDSCASCQLGCLKVSAHAASGDPTHDCGTNHACHDVCAYCRESNATGMTPNCAKPAGHEGRCECAAGDHTCRQPCCLLRASNCGKFCAKKAGHDPAEAHRCAVGLHKCGQACAVRECTRECVLDVDVPHLVHKCEVDRCLAECVMDGCNRSCRSTDHFHGHVEATVAFALESADRSGKAAQNTFDASSATPVIHMCGEPHACPEMCAQDGVCHIDVFLKQSSKTFVGARGTFQYTFQEMNGSRKRCTFRLEAGQTTHAGQHSCCRGVDDSGDTSESADGVQQVRHYCDVRCPCCSYYCQREHGHDGRHKTTHGNMRNTVFLSDATEIDLMDRKYAAGERGTAEMCSLYCAKMGRGHVHYLDCERDADAPCVYSGSDQDMRRHCTRSLEPAPEAEQDEVLHERFWDTLGWEDPCASEEERREFAKCAYKCDAPDHDGKTAASLCVLPAWHLPAARSSAENDGYSYVGGHKFSCSHVSESNKMHHVFVLDSSGSMAGAAWQKLLGAFSEYIENRIAMGATRDLVSVVTFASAAEIHSEAQAISAMIKTKVPFSSGGTSYVAGLRSANEVLSRVAVASYKPVVVLFSDGHPHDALQGEELATHIAQSYAKYGLEAFVVGFGKVNLAVLQRVARKLGGAYHHVLCGDELKTTFHAISASVGTHAGLALTKPLHEMVCVICQKELASEATAVLAPCQHELHQRCLRRLQESSATSDHASQCPTCRGEIHAAAA